LRRRLGRSNSSSILRLAALLVLAFDGMGGCVGRGVVGREQGPSGEREGTGRERRCVRERMERGTWSESESGTKEQNKGHKERVECCRNSCSC